MDYKRTIPVQTQLNALEHMILQWLAKRQARSESECLRELIRKAGDDGGFFSELAKARFNDEAKAEPSEVPV